MRNRIWLGRGACGVLLASTLSFIATGFPVGATEPDDFRVRTTKDLVALCSADPAGANYVAAIHFCHGFGSGAYQYYDSLAAVSASNRFVCLPDPPPTRSEAVAGFVAWARANPKHMPDRPVDSIFRYLSTRYPCGQ